VVDKPCYFLVKRLSSFSDLQINIQEGDEINFFFFLTIGPTSFIDLPKKNIKISKVQTKNYFELNLIELFFLILSLDDLSFAKKKIYNKQIGMLIK